MNDFVEIIDRRKRRALCEECDHVQRWRDQVQPETAVKGVGDDKYQS